MAGVKTDQVYDNLDKGPIDWPGGKRPGGWGNFSYRPEYCKMAFDILSSDALKTKSHLCVSFQCSKPTIVNWIKTFPEFREAVECGLAVGEQKFREKIADHSFQSSKLVNNGLIKMMAANVYGIKEDISPLLVVNNPAQRSAEEEMAERGIPMPICDVPDFNDPNSLDCDDPSDQDLLLGGVQETPEDGQRIKKADQSEFKGERERLETPEDNLSKKEGNSFKQEVRPLTEREKAILFENLKLKGQIRAQTELLKKEQERGVKGFGSDFDSSDEKVASPFGLKKTGLSRFNE